MSQENTGQKTFRAGEVMGLYCRVKLQAGAGDTVMLAQAGEEFIGITATAGVNVGDMVNVTMRSAARTYKMTASGVIAVGALFYGAASGKIQATASGLAQGTVLEAAANDGEIIECVLNNGAAVNISGAATNVEPEAGNGSIPMIFSKTGIADATASPTIVTAPYKFRVINWWIVSRDATTTPNVKLINVATDMTAVIAKPATADTIVPGGTIVNAQKDVLVTTALKVNASVVGAFDVYVMAVKV